MYKLQAKEYVCQKLHTKAACDTYGIRIQSCLVLCGVFRTCASSVPATIALLYPTWVPLFVTTLSTNRVTVRTPAVVSHAVVGHQPTIIIRTNVAHTCAQSIVSTNYWLHACNGCVRELVCFDSIARPSNSTQSYPD